MTERENLIRLIDKSGEITSSDERLADFLLSNGVIVLPCKVGDTVYIVNNGKILEEKLVKTSIWYETEYYGFDESLVGQELFFSREDAESALAKLKGE